MNVRALTFGALIGFVVAFAPSCTPKCGPQNCGGCCDSKGTCVKSPNNNNNTTCGSVGNTCTDCAAAGSTCNTTTSTCTGTGAGGGGGGTGGGTGGGGSTCTGCSTPNGTCLPGNTVINCGVNNARCVACGSGESCTNGVCMTPMSGKTVGSPCANDTECQMGGLGAMAICKLATTSGNGIYSGGYCTLNCRTSTCPMGSVCVGAASYGEADAICWDSCSGATDCRPGYACYGLTTGRACWINPIPMVDAGTPADKVGNACTSTATCINPPDNGGVCLSREFNYDWAALGGYCSRDNCRSNRDCAVDGGAICLGFSANDSACVQKCADSTSDGGQSTCRNGFTCDRYYSGLPDGGQQPSVDGYCVPPQAPIPTTIGNACANDLACKVPTGAIADCISDTLSDGGPSGVPGGECTRLGCSDSSDCSGDGGAQCFFFTGGGSQCFRMCAASGVGQSTCRTGYVCASFGIADGGQSANGVCEPGCNVDGGGCRAPQTCNAMGYCQ